MSCIQSNRQKECVQCQGKMADQTLNQTFGLPGVLVAVGTSRLSCKRAGKTRTLMPVWDLENLVKSTGGRSGAAHSARCRQPILERSERSRHAANSVGRVGSM